MYTMVAHACMYAGYYVIEYLLSVAKLRVPLTAALRQYYKNINAWYIVHEITLLHI